MQTKIFYSWQSDLEKKYNWNFIESCIKKAKKELKSELDVFIEMNLDRDTKGEFGTIDIVETIFKKIDECHIFIADISLINSDGKKKTPNPNVLIELGYAASKIGWKNIITVFNKKYGEVEDLPFDLKFRRPLIYNYDFDTTDEEISKLKKSFILLIKESIKRSNPELVRKLERLNIEFAQESKEAIRLINVKPDLWRERLIKELFRFHIEAIEHTKFEIDNKLILEKIESIGLSDFLDFAGNLFKNLGNLMRIFTKTFNALSEDHIDDDIEIAKTLRKNIVRACKICEKTMEWEIELLQLDPPEYCLNLKEYLLNTSLVFLDALKQILKNITQFINDSGTTTLIKIKLANHNFDQITLEMERLTKMIHNGEIQLTE